MIRESQIQSKIIRGLEKRGWYVNKLIQTTRNGTPDLIAHRDGRTMYVEVKRPGEKASKLQTYRLEKLYQQGIDAFVIDDPERLWNYLDQQAFI